MRSVGILWCVLCLAGLHALPLYGQDMTRDECYERALQLSDEGKAGEAVDLLTKAIRLYPKSDNLHQLYYKRAHLYLYRLDNSSKAISDLNRAIKAYPDCLECYYIRADAYDMKGRWQNCVDDLSVVIEHDPPHLDGGAYYARAECHAKRGDQGAAIDDYTKAIAVNPEGAYYLDRGAAYYNIRNYEKAKEDFLTAISAGLSNRGLDIVFDNLDRLSKHISLTEAEVNAAIEQMKAATGVPDSQPKSPPTRQQPDVPPPSDTELDQETQDVMEELDNEFKELEEFL